jgi:hypothetical protein
LVINQFDEEISRLPEGKRFHSVMEHFTRLYLDTDIYKFFILYNLNRNADSIFSDTVIRDFTMNLTDRVSFLMTSKSDYDDMLINSLVTSITRNKPNPASQGCYIDEETRSALYISEKDLTSLLKNNFWLLIIIVLSLFFNKTALYKQLIQEKVKP